MTMEAMDPDILCLLHRLGITANYTGFFHTARAIRLCAEEPDRLLLVTKLVYPEYFEGVDPVSVVSEYYDLFMPWSFDGTWSYTLV